MNANNATNAKPLNSLADKAKPEPSNAIQETEKIPQDKSNKSHGEGSGYRD